MVRKRLLNGLLAGALVLGSSGMLVACDPEDEKDVQEVIDEGDKQIDKLDTDGKDD